MPKLQRSSRSLPDRLPERTSKAIKIGLQNAQDGTLREVIPPENGNEPTCSELAQGTAWNGVVAFGFKCQTYGQSFRFHCSFAR
jgi:hypothetical protein